MAKTGATITSVVQSIVFDQLHREEEFNAQKDTIRLNRIQIGSAPVLAQSVQEFNTKFGIRLYQGYGQTETALRVTGVPMDISDELYERLVEENSIGEPMQWADLQIADDVGKFLGEGEEGELVVKGPAVMEGYLGMEPAFRDGYFLTGDIGYFKVIDSRKYFYLKGRKREIIIKGGINISPVAIENALKKISTDIDQAHVISVVDERYGEEPGAVISWRSEVDEEAAKRRLKAALLLGTPYLSEYETPKYITSLSIKDLPTTSTGKVQRSVLKDRIPYEKFESIYGLLKTSDYRFSALHRNSRWEKASFDLFAKCWAPIQVDKLEYEKNISKQLIVLAAKPDETLVGQIAVIRTSLTEKELLTTKYADLLAAADREGGALVCISICSANYEPKPVPEANDSPTPDEVRKYLAGGHDPVMKFHQKPKGGLIEGATLVDVIENGRPEDKSALGYNMLLKYPAPSGKVSITEGASAAQQLIEVILLLASDMGIKNIYAYSRPGGLAQYLASYK